MTQPNPANTNFEVTAPVAERWRPKLHFTPAKNWINDPNGLVYFEGEYHLFYQYNPFGRSWGHMSWGHAVSRDLVTWTELPVAIPEREFMIFSGCALVDWHNVSGLGDGGRPPLLAFFTAYEDARQRQSQCLAYSHDRGRTWAMFRDNPIIDLDMEHHRDPNVFWHEPSRAWIMVVSLPRLHQVEIYRSTDLCQWERASVFGPAGGTGGQWECPALIEVPDEAASGRTRWVLKVDVDRDLVLGGSGAQYFVGDFDGWTFVPQRDADGPIADIVDFGRDFYAAISWSDLPATHTHPVWVAWMSNHQSGKDYPTDPWRGAMTLPRELFTFEEEGRWRLGQRPIAALSDSFEPTAASTSVILPDQPLILAQDKEAVALDLELLVDVQVAARLELRLEDSDGLSLTLEVDRDIGEIRLTETEGADRREIRPAPYHFTSRLVRLRLVVDGCCVEAFVDGGRRAFAQCWFPKGGVRVSVSTVDQIVKVGWLSKSGVRSMENAP